MKHVEIRDLISAVPVKMTRRQKLLRWAELVRKTTRPLHLFHGLEYMRPSEIEQYRISECDVTALGVAASDPEFQAQGLSATSTLGDALRFFALTVTEAHAFSCDCGGAISNDQQADRIAAIAR